MQIEFLGLLRDSLSSQRRKANRRESLAAILDAFGNELRSIASGVRENNLSGVYAIGEGNEVSRKIRLAMRELERMS